MNSVTSDPRGNGRFKSALRNRLLNIGLVASYWIFPERYFLYQVARRFLDRLLGRVNGPLWDKVGFHARTVVIEGFRHSGNSFVVSNVHKTDEERVRSHIHRPWVLRQSVRAGAPTVVLFRSPLETALSIFYRTKGSDAGYGTKITPVSALLCWIGFYSAAWKYRKHIVFVDFSDLQSRPLVVFERLSQLTGLRFRKDLNNGERNSFDGPRPPVVLTWRARLVLLWADRLHARMKVLAA